jgi:hypothetical protein
MADSQDPVQNQKKENMCPNAGSGSGAPPPPPPPPPPGPLRAPSGEDIKDGLRYIFGWPERDLDTLTNLKGPGALRLLGRNLRVTTYSSACSGVDSPGTSLRMLTEELKLFTGLYFEHPPHLHATEIDDACRRELEAHPSPPECLFRDLTECWTPSVAKKINALIGAGFSIPVNELIPLILSNRATKKHAFCAKHRRNCPLRPARVHFAGLPCVDWSPQGARKRGDGATALVYAAWASVRLALQDHIVVHENHASFDPTILVKTFGHMYHVESSIIRATDRGVPQRRDRRWTVMIHRELIRDKARLVKA